MAKGILTPVEGPWRSKPASLGKLSQGIKTVFAVSISRENLTGIIGWKFISLKQPVADFFGRV